MRRLPPLSALRAFEAAARHGSFKRAATELGVTPTAISHQVRQLEERLGLSLFERRTRQVVATAAGRRLFPVLRDGFDAFAEAVEALRVPSGRRVLTLSATTAFTARWLVPRLGGFRAAFPDLDLRLHASEAVVDLHAGEADAAVRYGSGPYPDLVAEPLLQERFAPLCSPRLGLRVPGDLRGVTLLHGEWRQPTPRTPSWRLWCAQAGVQGIDLEAGITFTDDSHLAQAAVAGQGVALLSLVLAADLLAEGLLVQPFGPALEGEHYHFLHTRAAASRADLDRLRGWLLAGLRDGRT